MTDESRCAPGPVPGVPFPTDPFMTVELPVVQRSVPRTGQAGPLRIDPTQPWPQPAHYRRLLAERAAKLAPQAEYAAPGEMSSGPRWIADRFVALMLSLVAVLSAGTTVWGTVTGHWNDGLTIVFGAVGGLAIAMSRSMFSVHRDTLAELDPIPLENVALEPFTAVCRCPACDDLQCHAFAALDRIPRHSEVAATADAPLIWRECGVIGCRYVWAQLR